MFALVAFPCFAALYLVFAGALSATELAASLPAAILATVLARRFRQVDRRRFSLALQEIGRAFAGVPRSLATDIVRVGVALARGTAGELVRIPFAEDGPAPPGPGRRALQTLARSVAPNGIVVAISPGEDRIVLHRLAAGGRRRDRRSGRPL